MKIDHYIKEVLFAKDCVIIQDFGGFVCKNFASEINAATQMFMPPSKRVSFQPALNGKDLTLVNHIAQKQKISMANAEVFINKCVAQWKQELNTGKHIVLNDIGRIYIDVNGKLAFQADLNSNFNSNAFGLGIFRFPEINQTPTLQNQVKNVLPQAVRKQNGRGGYWKAAAVFIGVVGLLYLGTQKSDFKGLDYAGFNPLHYSKTLSITPAQNKIEKNNSTLKIEATNTAQTAIQTEGNSPLEIKNSEEFNKHFHVIVGAFKEKGNAESLVQSLYQKGFENANQFYEKGFYRVSVDQFSTRTQAATQLNIYKSKVQKGAWIYKN